MHVLIAFSLCLTTVPPRAADLPDSRRRVVDAADRYLQERAFHGDCCTFVRAVFARAAIPLSTRYLPGRSGTEALYRQARRTRRPRPGDIAVFHDTYDRNHDGKVNDPFTHVAVVEAVAGPRVTLVHRGSAGIARLRMNVHHPDDRKENSVLRKVAGRSGRLTGQLFTGFGALVDDRRLRAQR
jgi:hypothetical protein